MRLLPLLLGIGGVLLLWAGGAWDVAWHRTIGRDTFFGPPHLLIYGGVTVSGLAALAATIDATRSGRSLARELRVGPLRVELGLGLIGLGALGVILTGPFDELWHRMFGRDVDIWSVPHLLAVALAGCMYVGCALALTPGAFPLPERLRLALRAIALGSFCGLLVFGTNFYYFAETTREALFYPLAIAATVPFTLALGAALLPWRWSATVVAGLYTLGALATEWLLGTLDWLGPAPPPLILVGAIAVDLARARRAPPLAIGAAFAFTFVAAEAVRALVDPVGPAGSVPQSIDSRAASIYFQYVNAALARPWTSLWPMIAAIAAVPVATLAWVAGLRLVDLLDRPAALQRLRSTASPSPRVVTS